MSEPMNRARSASHSATRRLLAPSGEGHPAACALVVELVSVVQREDRVDKCPGQHDGDGREDEIHRLAAPATARGGAELGEDRGEARQRRGGGQYQDGECSFVLSRRAATDTLD